MSENLWSFALRIYAAPGVAGHCLDLQERFKADVNLLLAALWLASRQRIWADSLVAELEQYCAVWRQYALLPLRSVRRASVQTELYSTLKTVEVIAERIQIDMIARRVDCYRLEAATLSAWECARQNLTCYAQRLNLVPDNTAIETLLDSCAQVGAL
jgi:uncharacterized protein (TIGR02444 family)